MSTLMAVGLSPGLVNGRTTCVPVSDRDYSPGHRVDTEKKEMMLPCKAMHQRHTGLFILARFTDVMVTVHT